MPPSSPCRGGTGGRCCAAPSGHWAEWALQRPGGAVPGKETQSSGYRKKSPACSETSGSSTIRISAPAVASVVLASTIVSPLLWNKRSWPAPVNGVLADELERLVADRLLVGVDAAQVDLVALRRLKSRMRSGAVAVLS